MGHAIGVGKGLAAALSALLLPLVLLTLPPLVPAPPMTFTDSFVTNCTAIPDSPSTVFKLWSDINTWTPLGFTGIPGVSVIGANVTIPCGTAVLLDAAVPKLNLTTLDIRGHLKVQDPAVYTEYLVVTCLVLVEGQLTIGSFSNQFKSKITFLLMPNPINRQTWKGTFVWPAEPAFPRDVGHKAFAVMGGQVSLHGMPGGINTPSWIKLNATLRAGDFQLIVDTDISALWPVGARIAVASTDYRPDYAEEFGIAGYDTDPRGTIIQLDRKATYNHYGDPFGIPDGFGGFIDERAEVALLTRQIVITGLDEQNTPFLFEGGHFIIFMTPVPQYVVGVQYFLMGQQGNLGRYNIHFHVCQDTQGLSVIRKNAITHSKQRCVVVHATHNVTVDSNIAYNTSGHCFMIEEGGEQNNTFINNLAIRTRNVVNLISADETDNSAASFWITNMMNNYINNVGAGSDNSGFWTELRSNVRGMSLNIPALSGIIPRNTPFGTIVGNIAHSNNGRGWQFYPKGVDPRAFWDTNQTTMPGWQWPSRPGFIYNLQVYKQQGDGVFMHNSANAFLVNMTAADCNNGVNLNTNTKGGVIGGRFLALSNNLGNPGNCFQSLADPNLPMFCAPATGCNITSTPGTWRFRSWNHWQNPTFGIHFDMPGTGSDQNTMYNISGNRFHGYDQQCDRVSAGVGTGFQGSTVWSNAGQYVAGSKSSTPTAPIVYFAPPNFAWPTTSTQTPSFIPYAESQTNYAVYDPDGSLVGGSGGYLIGTNPGLLPPLSRYTCTPRPQSNAVACPNTCYRTVRFWYIEPPFGPAAGPNRTRNQFSYMTVRRVEDNVTHILDGNSNSTDNVTNNRYFWINLFAPATYEVSINLPANNISFWPTTLSAQLWDNGGCGAPLTLRFMPIPASQWVTTPADTVFWSPCAGTTFTGKSVPWPVQFQYVCYKMRQVLQVTVLDNSTTISLVSSGLRVQPCTMVTRCGVWTSADWYNYITGGPELRPLRPGAMGYYVTGYNTSSWLYGQAVIGNSGWGWNLIRTLIPMNNGTNGITLYFRKSFTIANSACYAGIFLDFIPLLGHLVFFNGVEVFRWNLPAGNITNATFSLTSPSWNAANFNTTFINITATNTSFVEGTNYLAIETHSPSTYNYSPYFDTRVALLSNNVACTGASIMPEVCDGLDNNYDGLVDVDPVTGKVFTRPCATACGTGIETCINGAYQNCTATPSLPEVCNGKDDNCDGLVDNGLVNTQLDCANGSVCFQGQCLPQGPLTVPQLVFPRSTTGWNYLDNGWIWQSYPNWRTGQFSSNPNNTIIYAFKPGVAPFGTSNYSGPINTTINPISNQDIYDFYLRNYTLSAADAANTYALTVNVKRDQAVIVWANGVEIMRNNFPLSWNPPTDQFTYPIGGGTDNKGYWRNSPTRSTGVSAGAVRAGTNWIAAQVANTKGATSTTFDLELVQNANQTCSALPGSPAACIRNPPNDTIFFTTNSVWKYLDANYPLPAFSWISPSFDDSAWPSGPSPLGLPQWWIATPMAMNRTTRQAYYFRKTFSFTDNASCYYNFFFNLRALDGAVVYVNGNEAFRFQFTTQWVFPTSFSSNSWPATDRGQFNLSSGWLVQGTNTIAAEIHVAQVNTGNWYFDLTVGGQREAVNCSPLPP